jgi:radical SAM superfamily enzyme YgiQ (UPF0313 family)
VKTRRLLLLAMSGVRVQDERLRSLGLTLPGFVERGNVIASLPSLGLLTLAAHTPPHWEVEYQELDALEESTLRRLESSRHDLVAISSLSARIFEAYTVADRLRAAGHTVVLGGLHVSALPDEARAHADAVVQGEGEPLWAELLQDFESGRLAPFYSSRGRRPVFHLGEARVPRYELLELSRYNRLTLQTTRGCPLDCAFCGASRTISGYKVKPLRQVRRELEAILERWPRPFVELADDNTFASKGWARELARLLGEYEVRWFTETDISVADDERLLELLARSGCAQLLIGLEAVSPRALRGVDGRDAKARWAEGYAEKVRRIQSYGIAVNGCFIFGLDEDDEGSFERTRAFVEESGLCDVQITLLTPFPGTALHHRLKAEGRLLREVYWESCTLFDVTFEPRGLSAKALREGFEELMGALYSPEATARRRSRWRDCLRQGRERASAEKTHD